MTVEELIANLIRILSERQPYPATYLLKGNLISALQMSVQPAHGTSQDYPRMMYKRVLDGQDLTRVVNNSQEEAIAVENLFTRDPSPLPPGFPQAWVEIYDPTTRGSDYRRVRIRNAQEEQTFKTVIELKDDGTPLKWVRDDAYQLAGRPIGLNDLVVEHKEQLKRRIDEEREPKQESFYGR